VTNPEIFGCSSDRLGRRCSLGL